MISVQRDGNCAIVTHDDGKANALGSVALRRVQEVLREVSDADAVAWLGREKVFSAGLDLKEVGGLTGGALSDFMLLFHDTFRAMFAFERPMLACVRGSAVAGGAILMATADYRIGQIDSGVVGVNEARLGIVFPASALEIIRSALHGRAAHRALVLGELFDKPSAYQLGFFDELVANEQLATRLKHKLDELGSLSTVVVAATKKALRAEALKRMDEQKNDLGAFMQSWASEDSRQRVANAIAALKK